MNTYDIIYQNILAQMKQDASKKDDLGDIGNRDKIRAAIKQLNDWLANGAHDPYPIAVSQLGYLQQVSNEKQIEVPSITSGTIGFDNKETALPAAELESVEAAIAQDIPDEPGLNPPELLYLKSEIQQSVTDQEANPSGESLFSETLEVAPISPPQNFQPVQADVFSPTIFSGANPAAGSPQYQMLLEQFREAKLYADKRQWYSARRMARQIAEQAKDFHPLEDDVAIFYGQVSRALDSEVLAQIKLAEEAQHSGNVEEARRLFDLATHTDPDNNDIHERFREFLSEIQESEVVHIRLSTLQRNLRDRSDLRRLGDAVREASLYRSNGILPDDLKPLLEEADNYWKGERVRQGQITTMMHFGYLAARLEARDDIRDRVTRGDKTIYDDAVGTDRPAQEVLAAANRLYLEASKTALDYEFGKIKSYLPTKAVLAQGELEAARKQPFHEEDKKKLDTLAGDIVTQINKDDRALELIAAGDRIEDLVEKYTRWLEAQKIAPHLDRLQGINDTRQGAINYLCDAVTGLLEEAQAKLNTMRKENLVSVRECVRQARERLSKWPSQTARPPEFIALNSKADDIFTQINHQEDVFASFAERVAEIRKNIANPSSRKLGLKGLTDLREDPAYKQLPELAVLAQEIDPFLGVFEKLTEARIAAQEKAWKRVYDLTGGMIKDQSSGEFSQEVKTLRMTAESELLLARIRDLLDNQEVRGAEIVFRDIAQQHPAILPRLVEEKLQLKKALEATDKFQQLIQKADQLSLRRNLDDLIMALEIFRYIGGDPTTPRLKDWPEYALSGFSKVASSNALQLEKKICKNFLTPLLERCKGKDDLRTVSPETLHNDAEIASKLREAHLLVDDEAKHEIRRIEIAKGEIDGGNLESAHSWEQAALIWDDLKNRYPRFEFLRIRWRNARIEVYCQKADLKLGMKIPAEAIQLLIQAQGEEGIGMDWRLSIKLADAYAALDNYDQAEGCVNDAMRYIDGQKFAEKKLIEIRLHRRVSKLMSAVKVLENENRLAEVLEQLNKALNDPEYDNAAVLVDMKERIFNAVKTSKLKRLDKVVNAHHMSADGSQIEETAGIADQINALMDLVDLDQYEIILGIPKEKRTSTLKMSQLAEYLEAVARQVLTDYQEFQVQLYQLPAAIVKAQEISGRLRTLNGVADSYPQKLSFYKERFYQSLDSTNQALGRLKNLESQLRQSQFYKPAPGSDEAKQESPWERAVLSGDFGSLNLFTMQINNLGLEGMKEVGDFGTRVSEWEEVHSLLTTNFNTISQNFSAEEYDQVHEKIVVLRVRPPRRKGNGDWKQIDQPVYSRIYELFNQKVIIPDIFGDTDTLKGFEEIDSASEARHAELEQWKASMVQTEMAMKNAQNQQLQIDGIKSAETATMRKSGFEKILQAENTALDLIQNQSNQKAHSKKAAQIKSKFNEWKREIEGYRTIIKSNLENEAQQIDNNRLPEIDFLANLTRELKWKELQVLLEKVDMIGSLDPEYNKRVGVYKKILREGVTGGEAGRKSWLQKFFDRLKGNGN